MKKLITMIIMAGIALPSMAQKNFHFEMEADPIAYVLRGYSLHGIVVKNRLRTDLGIFGIEQPEGYSGNPGFQTMSQGVGLKLNYLLDEKKHWFSGIGIGYTNNTIRYKESGQSDHQAVMSIGVHAGYRWFMFGKKEGALKNLYLTPWMSIDFNKPITSVKFENSAYTQKTFSVFPTIHIGYRFRK